MSFLKKFSNRGLGLRVELIHTALFVQGPGFNLRFNPQYCLHKKLKRLSLQQLKGCLQKFVMIWEILYNAKQKKFCVWKQLYVWYDLNQLKMYGQTTES